MYHCRITVMSHGIKVDKLTANVVPILRNFSRSFIEYEWKRPNGRNAKPVKMAKCVYAASPNDGREYRFARSTLDDLIAYLGHYGIGKGSIEMYERPMYEPVRIKVKMPESWVAREKQVPIIDYVCANGHTKAVTMQTGQGKTDLSLKVVELLEYRTAITLPSKYLEQWTEKVKVRFGIGADRIMVVKGFKQMLALMQLAYMGDFNADVLLISSTTWQQYLQFYETTTVKSFPQWFITPEDFYEKLGVGLRVLDEAHEFFHLNYKMDVYMHIPKSLALSATLDPDDEFLKRMYALIFPLSIRMNGGAYIKYIDVTALTYQLEFWDRVKCTGGQGYNHVVFEQWIMKKEKTLNNYLRMIYDVVKEEYLAKRVPRQKLLIYAATTDMCRHIKNYLEEKIDDDVVVNKYTNEDAFQTLLTSDISSTTLGSAGTGVDVPDLITCIVTVAVSSSQRNLQVMGRLRELHQYPGLNPHFIYFVCKDITKHVEYHRKKQELFVGKVLSHRVKMYDKRV